MVPRSFLRQRLLTSDPSRAFCTQVYGQFDSQMRVPYHPSVRKETMQRLIKHFPDALFALEANQRVNFALLKEGSRPRNTLFACSVCPDEINHYPNSLNNRLTRVAGRAFYMGGLEGIAFIGKVGYNAFTAHMPKDGNLVIQFCPHVGVSRDGEFGRYSRQGQDKADLACGAAVSALRWLEENEWAPQDDKDASVKVPEGTDTFDYQFAYIVEALKPHYAEIVAHEEPMVALAYAMYEVTRRYIESIVIPIAGAKVTMLGGIQINV